MIQITRIHASPYRAVNANFRNFGASYRHGTVFAPKQYLYQKVALGMQSTKILSLGWCKKGTNLYGLQITRIYVSPYRSENANFRNFGASYRHGTVFAPKQYLYQKEALGMQSTKILSLGWCKKGTNLYGLQITRIYVSPYRSENANFRNFGASYRHGTVFAPKQYLYQKEALGMQSTKYYHWLGAKRAQTSTELRITRIHV